MKTIPKDTNTMSVTFTDGSGYLLLSFEPHTKAHWRRHAADLARQDGKALDKVNLITSQGSLTKTYTL